MKRIFYICSALCLFSVCSADGNAPVATEITAAEPMADDATPTIYADVSQSAVDNAVSFDGMQGLFGIDLGFQQYNATISSGSSNTSNSFNVFGLAAGIGYTKAFQSNLLLGGTILLDLSFRKKKEGNWRTLNADFDGSVIGGDKKGKLETDIMTPSIDLIAGYAMPERRLALFAKLGVARVTGSYTYYQNGGKHSDIDVVSFVPTLGIGANYKFNKQWGVYLEGSMPIKRRVKKSSAGTEHRIKMGRGDIRVLATYSLGQSSGQ